MGKNQDKNEIFDKEKGLIVGNLLKEFKRRKLVVIIILVMFFVLGVLYALTKPNVYKSSVTFLPQVTGSPKLGGLGGLAALAGVKINSSGQSGKLSPIIYPEIFESIRFRLLLSESSISIGNNQTQLLIDHFNDNYKSKGPSPLGYVLKPLNWILNSSDEQIAIPSVIDSTIIRLTKPQRFVLEQISDRMDIEINEVEGYIRLACVTENPSVSAQAVTNASKILQETVIDIEINRAKEELKYLKKRLIEQEGVFQKAQLRLANYKDRNQFASTQRTSTVLNKLQSDYDLAFGVYLDLAQQVESQQLQVKKDTPIFTIIDKASVSKDKVGPNRLFIVGLFLVLGFFIVLLVVVGKQYSEYLMTATLE